MRTILTKSITGKLMLATLVLFSTGLKAVVIPQVQKATLANSNTSTVTVGAANAFTTIAVAAPGSSSKDSLVNGAVKLYVDYKCANFVAPYTAQVTVSVTVYDVALNPTSNLYVFNVSNQPYNATTFTSADQRLFINQSSRVYKIDTKVTDVKINGVTTNKFPNNLILESSIEYLRYDDFLSYTSPSLLGQNITPIDFDCNNLDESINITWTTVPGAIEYQLEWAFINDYSALSLGSAKSTSALLFDFKNNSTRISTSKTNYLIPVIADRGYFIYRVRAVGQAITALAAPIYGLWTAVENGNLGMLNPNSQLLQINNHFESAKNWQYNVTYAEEGKHKDVISYYDGSLRNRQSITQVSTDATTLVGETIYDFTGRPAISVLPAPLPKNTCIDPNYNPSVDPNFLSFYSFNYVPNFNMAPPNYVVNAPHPYTKKDFDLVDPVNSCSITTSPMVLTSGASKYYSTNNQERDNQQAFVPDANLYPFSQTEFTPDNTGRIRKQSGVGVNHQLGTDHETNYFYSIPTQLELDRLFGSEVGNAAHYQKNMVIDPNGQVSISYVDMSGKTIATALAGSPPQNLVKLSSAPAATSTLTADVFNKDANGNSISNKPNLTPDAIVFNSSFMVTQQSVNTFTYNFSVDTVGNPCLKPGICFSCVYDLDIKILNECGEVLYSSPITPPSADGLVTPVAKLVGNFSMVGGNIVFKTQCSGSSVYNYPDDVFITPPYSFAPGVYTISKTLRVNAQARNFYLAKFFSKRNNICIKDANDFLQDELAKIDTTDCFISCQSCFQNLGKKDDFVAQGRGTDLEWEALYAECDQLCGRPKSKCEIAYEQMIADMSPSGQYGGIKVAGNTNYNPGAFPLSIFNPANLLPKNIIPTNAWFNVSPYSSPVAFWKKPEATVGGNTYQYYFDKTGQRSKVTLYIQPGAPAPGYNLAVDNPALVFPGTSPGSYYTWPENLTNIADFIQRWNPNWGKSLIVYHPEYCYYQDCIAYSTKQCNDTITSEDFDKKLWGASTYNDAVTKKLIITSGTNNVFNYGMDPFVACTPVFNSYSNSLVTKYNNYNSSWGTNMNMAQFAASLAHCGTQYGQSPFSVPNCTNFGFPVPGTPAFQDSVRNQEWNTLKSLYMAEKNKLQIQRSNDLRFIPFNNCSYYNGCIGNDDYNPHTGPMFMFSPSVSPIFGFSFGALSFFQKPYFDAQQPCNIYLKDLYKEKAKRFGASEDVKPLDQNAAAYQVFLQTGQCQNAYDLQGLMDGMAISHKLNAANEALVNHPQFTPNLYNVLNNSTTFPPAYVNYLWKAVSSVTTLNINLVNSLTNAVKATLVFNNPSTGFNWNNVVGIIQLQANGSTSSGTNFKATLQVQTSSSAPITNIQCTGFSSIILDDCKFKDECSANDFAKDLLPLLSALKTIPSASSADFFSNSPVPLTGTSAYNPLISTNIKNVLASPSANPNMVWVNNPLGSFTYEIYDVSNPACKLVINLTGATPSGLSQASLINISSFSNIKSDYQNFFTMDGKAANGNQIANIRAEVYRMCGSQKTGISMGTCGLPQPMACRSEYHQTRNDLELLLADLLNNKKYTPQTSAVSAQLTSNTLFNNNLKSKINPIITSIVPGVISVSSNIYKKNFRTIHDTALFLPNTTTPSTTFTNDKLSIQLSPTCQLTLQTNNKPYKPQMLLSNLVSATQLTGYGQASNTGNYNYFYMVADFNTSGGLVHDTVYGFSCFDIQNCNTCADTAKPCCGQTNTTVVTSTVNPGSSLRKDSVAVAQGKALQEDNVVTYKEYLTAIDSLNTRFNWTPADTNYIVAQSYTEFSNLGFNYAKKAHIRFIKYFDPIVDTKADIKDFNRYFKSYGHSVNPTKEYQRYCKAVLKYNQKAIAASSQTLTPIEDTLFFKMNMPDSIPLYVKYLNQQSAATSSIMTETQFFAATNGLNAAVDTCTILYKSYVDAYKDFVDYQNANSNPCPEFLSISPMYTLDEFIKNNYCCSQAGYLIFNQYINSFYNHLACPQPISVNRNCSGTTEIPAEVCAKNYNIYIDIIKQYNLSAYAINNNVYIVNPYPTFTAFSQAGLCACVSDYIKYLEIYAAAPPGSSLAPPVAINNYTACGPPKTIDECTDKYNQYLAAVTAYNNFVVTHPTYTTIDIRYKAEQFTASGFCYCVEGYVQFLNAIVNGTITDPQYIKEHLSIADYCLPPKLPCIRPNKGDTLISPPMPPDRNPCVVYKYDLAAANAQLAWQQYVQQQTTDFVKFYNSRCLKATENFFRTYEDGEFHQTLYYYDQAGNLIRTIPPAGIDQGLFNSILAYSSPKEVQAQQDRANNTHNLLTNHNLATTYLYNSLNQLVKQNMPDHDVMDYSKNQYAWGLDTNLNVLTSQFVNSNKGYLAGFKTIPSTVDVCSFGLKRGMIYETADGGINWQPMSCTVGANIKKARFVTTQSAGTIGFAVGSDGTFMVSYDNGNNWDLVPIPNISQFTNFTDIAVNPNNNNKIEGFIVGERGLTINFDFRANNSAPPSYNIVSNTNTGSLSIGDIVTSITSTPSNGNNFDYFISVLNPATEITQIYKSNNALNQWQNISDATAPKLNKVFHVRGTPRYYIGGADGTLLRYDNSTALWIKVLTNTKANFKDIYFMDDYAGIAILEDPANSIPGAIYKTTNSGKTWTLLDAGNSANGLYYSSLSPYVKGQVTSGNTSDKLVACGTKGLVKRISIITTSGGTYQFGAVNTSINTTNSINDAMVVAYDNSTKYFTIAAGTNGAIYYSTDYNQNNIVWNQVSSVPTTLNSKKIIFDIKVPNAMGNNTKVNGVIMDNSGALYMLTSSAFSNLNTLTFATGVIGNAGLTYKDMILKNYNILTGPLNDVYLMGTNGSVNTKIARLDLTNMLTSLSAPTPYGNNINSTTMLSFAIRPQDDLVAVGTNGEIFKNINNNLPAGPLGAWTTESTNVRMPKVNNLAVAASAGNKQLIASGDQGLFAQKDLNVSSAVFMIKTTATLNNFNAVSNYAVSASVNSGAVTGSGGYLAKYTAGATQVLALTPIATNLTADLNDVTTNVAGINNYAYAVGNSGKAVYVNNLSTSTPLVNNININTSQNLYGVSVLPASTNVLVVGNNMQTFVLAANLAMKQRTWFTNRINKLHFATVGNGYFVGDIGLIRHTTDGGASWQIVRPYTVPTSVSPTTVLDHNAVFTKSPDNAVIGANRNYLSKVSGLSVSAAPQVYVAGGNRVVNDISFNGAIGYAVATNTSNSNGILAKTIDGGNTWTQINLPSGTSGLNALHQFASNAVVAVGNNNTVIFNNGSSTTAFGMTVPGAGNLNDVIFLDDKNGYIVGNNGRFYNTSNMDPLLTSPNPAWTPIPLTDQWLTANTNLVNLNTISFSDRYDGFIAGNFNNTFKYARKIHDETGKFSTFFWYDRLGRMVVSQNSKQRSKLPKAYSYTLYDKLGRIVEVGEKAESTTAPNTFESIFGTVINGYLNTNAIDDAKLGIWIANAGTRTEITKTYYDDQKVLKATHMVQENLRKRVASVTFSKKYSANDTLFDNASHYSYDIHGNVKTLVQDNRWAIQLDNTNTDIKKQRFKHIDYDYDLVSGKVNKVSYQKNQPDQFYHVYNYDADNRIIDVQTSKDGINWETDANYAYYKHGPLARTELGEDNVQGMDYAYTIQGWIKGVNSNLLNPDNDMGKDGGNISLLNSSTNTNHFVARDAAGYTLGYFNGDYSPIEIAPLLTTGNSFVADMTGSSFLAASKNLYNGNISSMVTTIQNVSNYASVSTATTVVPLPLGMAYTYDQLNRIDNSLAFNNLQTTGSNANTWSATAGIINMYRNSFTYDGNGNILTQTKHDQAGTQFEDLKYNYYAETLGGRLLKNRLYHVDDIITNAGLQPDDIEDQGTFTYLGSSPTAMDYNVVNTNVNNNYRYDKIGNLIKDTYEGISNIEWTVYGKIDSIVRTGIKTDLKFLYDAGGNRLAKIEKTKFTTGPQAGNLRPKAYWNYTYYIRDAQGNVMATYKQVPTSFNPAPPLSFKVTERGIYGSSRVGLDKTEVEFVAYVPPTTTSAQRILGNKQYELGNHLGNVLTIVSDRKIPVDNNADNVTDYYLPDVVSATDYYPFGSPMPSRSFSASSYRYGFNGQENDDEINGGGNSTTAAYWQYDARLGRRWNIDPEYKQFANESPYAAFHNNPTYYCDPFGNKPKNPEKEMKKFGKKVEKEFNAHKNEEGYTKDDAINAVAKSLPDNKRYVVQHLKEESSAQHYQVYDIVEYYKSWSTNQGGTGAQSTLITAVPSGALDRGAQGDFDQWYTIPAGAISIQVDLKNVGNRPGTFRIVYDVNGSQSEVSVTLKANSQNTQTLIRGTTFIAIEIQTESTDRPGVSAKLEAVVQFQLQTPSKQTFYKPMNFIEKPKKEDYIK